MSKWIRLNRRELDAKQTEFIGGVLSSVLMSPHDVPTAIRSRETDDHKHVVIEFQYMDDEEWRPQKAENGLVFRVGEHSGRLYGMEIPHALIERRDHVEPQFHLDSAVDHAIQQLEGRSHRKGWRPIKSNYEVAKKAIDKNIGRLLPEVT